MRFLLRALLLLILLGYGADSLAQPAPDLVITNTTVLPMNRNVVLRGQTVLIRAGRIQKLGAPGQINIPRGAVVVDGTGKFLLPGLTDMHAHLPGPEGNPHSLDTYFRLNLASGVTALRTMRGSASQLRWRDSLRRSAGPAPRLYLGSPVLTRDKNYSSRQGPELLSRYKASGYDFAKYLGGMTVAQYDSLLAAARQLHMPVAGHAPRSGLAGAVAAHMSSVEHIEAFVEAYERDSVQFRQLARRMAADQIFTCPDLYWYEVTWLQYSLGHLAQLPGLAYVDPRLRASWQAWAEAKEQQLRPQGTSTAAHKQLAASLRSYRHAFRIMRQEGVQFLISPGDGPYVVPGFGMAEELVLLVQHGLSPYEALRAATYNAAAWLGELQRGTIAPGQAADLVLLEADPLADIANVRRVSGVVLNGRWLPVAQLLPVPH